VALELQLLHHRASLETYRTLVRLQIEVRDRTVARTGPHSEYVFSDLETAPQINI